MHIALIMPVPAGSNRGNEITARRWAAILQQLGHQVDLRESIPADDSNSYDCLVALHARRSAPSIERFHKSHPDKPIIVCLTGTDLHRDLAATEEQCEEPAVRCARQEALRSLEIADRIVLLEPVGASLLAPEFRARSVVIYQSAEPLAQRPKPVPEAVELTLLAHLREVKDPFRAEEATRLLPDHSRIRVLHPGRSLSPEMAAQAESRSGANPRYCWVGPVSHDEALEYLCRGQATIISSIFEGAPGVISEAIVNGVPILATRIHATLGLLGADYAGLFEVGDTKRLAELMGRIENDPEFVERLSGQLESRRELFTPSRELDAWRALLDSLSCT